MKSIALLFIAVSAFAQTPDAAWPQATTESKPWTRWWWLGSAVDAENITRQLTEFLDAGLGGVEICPIYGAKGAEARFIPFLSPQWMAMLAHTTREAQRLGLGVDMTTGTGWPFGGPTVVPADASQKISVQNADGKQPKGKLVQRIPGKDGTEREIVAQGPLMKVKRAAPGGEGWVLDPYSPDAMGRYLATFDAAFSKYDAPKPRAHFHDSFEYFAANWTGDFPAQFEKLRGYPLPFAALAGQGDADTVARVKCDYRETLADLHLAYMDRWEQWARGHGSIARNQGHGAPCNLLDLYGAADIPETEIFRHVDERQIPMLKMASSAAHTNGHRLCSSETFTWLGEHFQVTFGEMKRAADFVFLGGVNHIFFHGIPYSPADAPWPGWLFYASTHLGQNGGLWHDMPAFTAYLTRVQSVMQSGSSSSDILLYYPQHDLWMNADGLAQTYTVHDQEKWLWTSSYYATATKLWERGYPFDALSDRALSAVATKDGTLSVGGNHYRAIVVPSVKFMPEKTLQLLATLADNGATVLFQGGLPDAVPGFRDIEKRTTLLRETRSAKWKVGGTIASLGIARETLVDTGLRCIRRSHDGGFYYFIVNPGTEPFDGEITLATASTSVVALDPMTGGSGAVGKRIQLAPGASIILRTFSDRKTDAPAWQFTEPAGNAKHISGEWSIKFPDGGPASYKTRSLNSWTEREDAKAFAGSVTYHITFENPGEGRWQLDLGNVANSARIVINGKSAGTLLMQPWRTEITQLLRSGSNDLEIEVTNLAANRIADLDRRKVEWKAFHEINFVNIDYKPFDASNWPLRESGLLGPVRLVPLK